MSSISPYISQNPIRRQETDAVISNLDRENEIYRTVNKRWLKTILVDIEIRKKLLLL